jgi:EAL domain-containing protein (putative c-di-GMP-specific phosphodiesterase class I)/GGDEF domain-containing protein
MTISCQLTEARRLAALRQLNLLDTPPAEAFDRITRMAARLFDLPIAAISLTDVDRQWFKSRVGIDRDSIPRMHAPCGAVTDTSAVLVVPDLLRDGYYRDSPLAASGVRYYAGAPLITADGHCLGAICVLGLEARATSDEEIGALRDLAGMVMAQIELQHALGRIDAVSGLPNRHQFIEDFQDLQRDRPPGELRHVVLINLATHEQLSYAARVMSSSYIDELVTDAASWLRADIDAARSIYHVAACQFALVSPPDVALPAYVALIEEKVRLCIQVAKTRYVMTPAVGLAPFEVGRSEGLGVLRRAQSAAHDAMSCTSHVAVYSAQEDAGYRRRFTLLNEFGAALEEGGQLRLLFQPRVDLRSGRCVGAEALLRWTHPELGGVGPGEFMPVIERSGLAQATTAWVLAAALEQQRRWRAQGLMLQLSVNVSPANLLDADFADRLAAGLAEQDLPPGCLELEITESALMEQAGPAHAMLEAISATGVRLAIDDFGTGYSSLSYLQSMPADVVKIDQSFIRNLETDARKQALVATMIRLSQDLGHRVVAEGVETEWAAQFLRDASCDEAQGYLYARPMEAKDFTQWRAAHFMPLMSA